MSFIKGFQNVLKELKKIATNSDENRFVCQEEMEDSAGMFLNLVHSNLQDVFIHSSVKNPTMRITSKLVDGDVHFRILNDRGDLCKKGTVKYYDRSRNPYTDRVMILACKKATQHGMTSTRENGEYSFSCDFKDFDWSKYRF